MLDKIRKFRWGYILLFIFLAAVGFCFLFFKDKTLETIAVVIGVLLAIYGAVHLALTIASKARGGIFAIKLIFSLIMITCGVITAISGEGIIPTLASLFGLYLTVDGGAKFYTAALSKRFEIRSWWVMLIPSLLVITGGYFAVRFCDTILEREIIAILLGITLMIDSIANLLSAFYIGAYDKRHEKDIEDKLIKELSISAPTDKHSANTDTDVDTAENTESN